jgi:hypothetical protein
VDVVESLKVLLWLSYKSQEQQHFTGLYSILSQG